jgi:hypothetical protein
MLYPLRQAKVIEDTLDQPKLFWLDRPTIRLDEAS